MILFENKYLDKYIYVDHFWNIPFRKKTEVQQIYQKLNINSFIIYDAKRLERLYLEIRKNH